MSMDTLMVLTGINVILILSLVWVYARNLIRLRSMFPAGLLIFALLFLVQTVVSFYYYVTMMPFFAAGLEGYATIFTLLQTLAFLVLNWLTWK